MINHPMLMQRDPPPEIDVTRPALPPLTPSERALIVDALEGIAKAIIESAAQPTSIALTVQRAPAVESVVAADQFRAGDRVTWHYVCGSQEWLRGIYSGAYSSNIVCRRPTPAELALHWQEVLP